MGDDLNISERNIRAAERAHDLENDIGKRLIDGAMRDAQEVMKALLLLNSGSAVALLAFIGAVVSKEIDSLGDLKPIIYCISWFLVGTVFAALTAGSAYFANTLYARARLILDKTWDHPYVIENRKSKKAQWWALFFNWAGVITAAISLVVFVCGIYFAAISIANLSAHIKQKGVAAISLRHFFPSLDPSMPIPEDIAATGEALGRKRA